jgi:OPA family glycerol-3-phosphate transporter-like MFS transporter
MPDNNDHSNDHSNDNDTPLGPDGKPDYGAVVTPAHPIFKHEPGFRKRRGRNWFLLGLTYASYYLCRYNLGIIAPELKEELNLSNTQYGAINSARNGMYAIGQFVNGLFTDKLGGKRAMTIGAVGTAILNVAFGLATMTDIGWIFAILLVIRGLDGYVQAFGAPGMVKINTAWFRKQERGSFAGIFGIMINLGQMGAGQLGNLLPLLAKGFSIPLIFFSFKVAPMSWQAMFFIPAAAVMVMMILMNLGVKNHPEEAGYRIIHDDEEADDDHSESLDMKHVFLKITSNKIVWIVAGAYFCTGFVRAAIYDWWTIYMNESWSVGKGDHLFWLTAVVMLPLMASAGSLSSGIISDKLFKGSRAPVATILYLIQVVFIAVAMSLLASSSMNSATLAVILILGIHTGCNATHSILGTAAAMDLGGRKMAGFAAGVIDSFQYFGAMFAGFGLGAVFDNFAIEQVDDAGEPLLNDAGNVITHIDGSVWFASMLPWALLGTLLMGYLWIAHRGKSTPGT